MKKTLWSRVLALVLALVLSLSLIGCGGEEELPSPAATPADNLPAFSSEVETVTADSVSATADENVDTDLLGEGVETGLSVEDTVIADSQESDEEAQRKAEEEKKLAEQRNSFSMMYYLAIVAEEIRTSKDNRLALEDIYSSLLNDINPGAIDEITQDHLRNLRDIIKSYLNISTKRERIQFIYNQEKASQIRNAVPNPLAILSMANSLDWRKLVTSVVYTAVDSYNNYKKAGESADMAFIMSGWELDDEEKDTVMRNRDRAFDYMVDMVQEYSLDGMKTLSEQAIEKYAEICTTENNAEKIELLLAEEPSYELLGDYWLELADAYYETFQYEKCLDCVSRYNDLSTGIYRRDHNYLRILPKAIVAAQETCSGEQYITSTSEFADSIISNTTTDDWSSRYFAAQVYLDLYSRTNDQVYIEKAYKIALENVTTLLKGQRDITSIYLNPIVEMTVEEPDYQYMTEDEKEAEKAEYKEQKRQANEYNKALKESREAELLSLYDPLILNCELLFALSDQMNLDEAEKAKIEAILQSDSAGVFPVRPVNDMYSFSQDAETYFISIHKDELIVPACLLTAGSKIVITAKQGNETLTADDCVVHEVERAGKTIDTFYAHVICKQLKKYEWTADSEMTLEITYNDVCQKTVCFDFTVSEIETHWNGNKVVFKTK